MDCRGAERVVADRRKSYQSAIKRGWLHRYSCGSCENGVTGERTAGSDMARESKESEAPANINTVRGVSH